MHDGGESISLFGCPISNVTWFFLLCTTLFITGIILCLTFHLLFFHIRLIMKNMTTYTFIMLQRQLNEDKENKNLENNDQPSNRKTHVQISQNLPTYKNKYAKRICKVWAKIFGKKIKSKEMKPEREKSPNLKENQLTLSMIAQPGDSIIGQQENLDEESDPNTNPKVVNKSHSNRHKLLQTTTSNRFTLPPIESRSNSQYYSKNSPIGPAQQDQILSAEKLQYTADSATLQPDRLSAIPQVFIARPSQDSSDRLNGSLQRPVISNGNLNVRRRSVQGSVTSCDSTLVSSSLGDGFADPAAYNGSAVDSRLPRRTVYANLPQMACAGAGTKIQETGACGAEHIFDVEYHDTVQSKLRGNRSTIYNEKKRAFSVIVEPK